MTYTLAEPAGHELKSFIPDLKAWAAAHPRTIFALLRRLQPILILKGRAVVTRYPDVQEVLARDEVFGTTYESGFRAITGGGNFFLGMDDTATYTRDLSNMRTVVRREDIPHRVGGFTAHTAERLVADAPGAIDVVGLGNAVLTTWVTDYFGVASPTPEAFAQWSATMSGYLFLQGQPGAPPESAAVDAGARMCAELDRQIAARKAARTGSDDVLERCLMLQDAGLPGMDDLTLRNNLLGLIVGAIPTSVTCIARALDELLRRPDQLAAAQAAAHSGNDALVQQYVFEAIRFNPLGPGVIRIARRDYELAAGSMRARLIPQGTTVIVAILSAMFDRNAFDDPDDFRIDRPPYVSLLFGFGRHTCFGQYINAVLIPAVVKSLLTRPNLRRAGELVLDGVFPSSLRVAFDSAQATAPARSSPGSTSGREESTLPPQRSVGGGDYH